MTARVLNCCDAPGCTNSIQDTTTGWLFVRLPDDHPRWRRFSGLPPREDNENTWIERHLCPTHSGPNLDENFETVRAGLRERDEL